MSKLRVRIELTDGTLKTIDLEPYLRGPIFEPLRSDPTLFRSVTVDRELGTIVWPNGADIDPDVLIEGRQAAWMEPEKEKSRTRYATKVIARVVGIRERKSAYKRKKSKK
jgi:hypothetical protein